MLKHILRCFLYSICLFTCINTAAQDKIYGRGGKIYNGKVIVVERTRIHFTVPDGPEYVMDKRDIDSIIYANGVRETMFDFPRKLKLRQNIPQLNTLSVNLLDVVFSTISLSYERRFKKASYLGIRIPLYIGYKGGLVPDVLFVNSATNGSFGVLDNGYISTGAGNGFAFATGFNPRFYFFKARKARMFAGPEVDGGYTQVTGYVNPYYYNSYINGNYTAPASSTFRFVTFAAMGVFGVSINPIDKLNIGINAGMGAACLLPVANIASWSPCFQFGIAIGPNF